MRPYTWLVANALFPLHEKVKGHTTIPVHKQLEQSQWLPPDEIRTLQIKRLRSFLCDIGEHVPYYRDLFVSLAFDPQAVRSIADLQELPLMGKPDIRANMDRMTAVDAGDLQRFNTGGSSGEPLVFLLGKERVSHDVAAKRRATRWWGVDIGDPEIVVWGSPIELNAQDRLRLARDKLFRTRLLSAFEMSEENLDSFVREIVRTRPRMLFGYPSSLAHIAAHAKARGIEMNDLGIVVAFVTSERLYDHQREQIEHTFGCRVANGYGGRDAGFIAHECPEGSLHITAEDIIVEIIRPDGSIAPAGESGEIVITHMATRDFPFARYRTGDIGAIDDSPCRCNRGLPVLTELQGRATDFVVAADGMVMHGLALIYVLRELDGVKEFKIIQESLEHMRVVVVPDDSWDESVEDVIVDGFKTRLGESVVIDVEVQTTIEAEPSGKRRYVVSYVTPAEYRL
jgi:phenylacetate-CoA ligase